MNKHTIMTGLIALAVLAGCGTSSDNSAADSSLAPSTSTSTSASASASATVTAATDITTAASTAATKTVETSVGTTDAVPTTSVPAAVAPLTVQDLLDLGRPIVLAHAGGEDEHPHSTPYGYAESVRAGVDMLDFDVQLTLDGVLVVQHDDNTGRTTNTDVAVAGTNYADLAQLDNAYWFTADCTCTGQPDAAYTLRGVRTGAKPPPAGYTPEDFIIPRFSDIARRFPNMPVNIEIKGAGAAGAATAVELAQELTELNLLDRAVVTSFDDTVVDAFHAAAPSVEITPGLALSTAWILNHEPLPAGMRILQLPPEFEGINVLTPESIAASHAAGYVVWVWPNDRKWENPEGYATLLAMGMDGLNINFPDQGVQAVKTFVATG